MDRKWQKCEAHSGRSRSLKSSWTWCPCAACVWLSQCAGLSFTSSAAALFDFEQEPMGGWKVWLICYMLYVTAVKQAADSGFPLCWTPKLWKEVHPQVACQCREEIWKLLSSVNLWGNLHVCVMLVLWNYILWCCMCVFVHRNYHVFYYLLAGASEEERKSFHLLKPEEYHYLNQVRIHALTHIALSACTRRWVQLPAFIPAILQFTCLHACSLFVNMPKVRCSSCFVWVQESSDQFWDF